MPVLEAQDFVVDMREGCLLQQAGPCGRLCLADEGRCVLLRHAPPRPAADALHTRLAKCRPRTVYYRVPRLIRQSAADQIALPLEPHSGDSIAGASTVYAMGRGARKRPAATVS